MTLEKALRLEAAKPARRRLIDEEHRTQVACVTWFRAKYPSLRHTLFAIPNGGRRDAVTGARLKEEGVLAGVADLALIKSNAHYGALFIEMKTKRGQQSAAQREWQAAITKTGEFKYVVCRSLTDFMREVQDYFADKK